MKITIKVTAKQIREGVQKSGHQCPIARALRVAYLKLRKGRFVYTNVGSKLTVIDGREAASTIKRFSSAGMPIKAQMFIIRFDRGELVRPFQITTELFRQHTT